MSGGGVAREGDTESKAGSRLWAVSTEPNVGLKLTSCEIMTWAQVRCLTDWATQAPHKFNIFSRHKPFKIFYFFLSQFQDLNLSKNLSVSLNFSFNVYFWERDRVWVGEGQRERGRHKIQSRLQAPSCQHRVRCRAQTPKMWDHDLNRSQMLNRLSYPGAPKITGFLREIKKQFWRKK